MSKETEDKEYPRVDLADGDVCPLFDFQVSEKNDGAVILLTVQSKVLEGTIYNCIIEEFNLLENDEIQLKVKFPEEMEESQELHHEVALCAQEIIILSMEKQIEEHKNPPARFRA